MNQPCKPGRAAVCSWSLRPGSARELALGVRRVGLDAVQLALDPIRKRETGWSELETLNALRASGIEIVSGMMSTAGEDYSSIESIRRTGGFASTMRWGENLRAVDENARLARRLGISLVTFHAGFIDERAGPDRRGVLDRLRAVVDRFDDRGVRTAFETGREGAGAMLAALDELDRPHAGVNFDPANILLYGAGDPVAALVELAPRVVQVHIKDATPPHPQARGEWGTEMPAGKGAVDWTAFFKAMRTAGLAPDLVIERESGDRREEDVKRAVDLLGRHGFGPAAGDRGPWHE